MKPSRDRLRIQSKNMKHIYLCILLLVILAGQAFAQSSNDASHAAAAVNKLFTEMANHNPEGIRAIYTPEAQLVAIDKRKDGTSTTRVFTADSFSKLFAVKRGELKEDMYKPEVRIFGDLAMVWGRYVFFIDGKISHCGVNSFHLVRSGTEWKIANAASTIEPQGCTDKEKKRSVGGPK